MRRPHHHHRRHAAMAASLVDRINVALHGVLVVVSLSIAFSLFDSTLFAWHPLFMSIGYLLFMAEGLISAVRFRHLDGPERVRAIQSHALWQLRAVLCVFIGFVIIYRNKVGRGTWGLARRGSTGVGPRAREVSSRPPAPSAPVHRRRTGTSPCACYCCYCWPLQVLHGKHHFTSTHGKVCRGNRQGVPPGYHPVLQRGAVLLAGSSSVACLFLLGSC